MRKKIILLIAFVAMLISIPDAEAARGGKQAQPAPLTQTGEALLADYTEQLNSLKTQIKEALPNISEQRKSVYLKAREVEKTAEAELETARKNLGKVKTAQALVAHAKGKWIGGADKGIAFN